MQVPVCGESFGKVNGYRGDRNEWEDDSHSFYRPIIKEFGIRTAVIGTTGVFIDGIEIDYNAPEMTTLPAEYLHPLLKKMCR